MTDPEQILILRRRQVQLKTGLSCSTLYSMIAEGTFPRPIRLGYRAVGWLEHEVDAWLADRIEDRDLKAEMQR